ncbi:MAG: DUF3306 domain-containing protein [Xanthobacteraceae bacterium]
MSKSENSELENFLTRWSSRKLANRTQSARQDAPAEHQSSDESRAVENRALAETEKDGDAQDNQPFDPAQLPPLDSIGADTNIAAFLRRDVPPELTRAALRRAWTSDPAIKNFVGLVENGWDFNDPSAMSGFGSISAEEVARLAGKVIEVLPAPEDQTKEVATSEKKSQLAKTNALRTGPLEAAPNTEEAGYGTGNDAAQQNKTGNKG